MASVDVKNASGKSAGSVDLADSLFGVQPNVPVMHQVVTAQLAHRRSGTQSTKTRAEVSGGGKKPFRQKGTGGARQGSIVAPRWLLSLVAAKAHSRSRARAAFVFPRVRRLLSTRSARVTRLWRVSSPRSRMSSSWGPTSATAFVPSAM